MIANLDAAGASDAGHWIKATAASDGSFMIMNGRNGFSRTYETPVFQDRR